MNVVAIDIGGTSMKGFVLDEAERVMRRHRVPTWADRGAESVRGQLFALLDDLVDAGADAIGIATAGRVNVSSGVVVYATDNLPGWHGFGIREAVEKRYGLPVYVDNDVNAAALGEWASGGAGPAESLLFVSIGTGIGAGTVYGGKVMHGAQWSSGEIGHVILYPEGRSCNCGKRGCLEQYVSSIALVQSANEAGGRDYANAKAIFEAYEGGDAVVAPVIERFAADLAAALGNLHNVLDTARIVVGGGVGMAHAMLDPLLGRALASFERPVPYGWSRLGDQAGLYGAALLARRGLGGSG